MISSWYYDFYDFYDFILFLQNLPLYGASLQNIEIFIEMKMIINNITINAILTDPTQARGYENKMNLRVAHAIYISLKLLVWKSGIL